MELMLKIVRDTLMWMCLFPLFVGLTGSTLVVQHIMQHSNYHAFSDKTVKFGENTWDPREDTPVLEPTATVAIPPPIFTIISVMEDPEESPEQKDWIRAPHPRQ